jgi:phosphoadenosine phosphosulfate reductase
VAKPGRPDEVINHEFTGRIALVSSFGRNRQCSFTSCIRAAATPVIFIDTGKIFGSTHRYREEIVSRLG